MCGPGTWPALIGVAQIHIGKAAGAHIAHGGKAGHQRGAGVDHAVDGLLGIGLGQLTIGIEVRVHGEVGVHVDQPGHDSHRAEIDDLVSGLGGNGSRRRDRLDGVAHDDDGLVVRELAGFDIEQMADTDEIAFLRRGGLGGRKLGDGDSKSCNQAGGKELPHRDHGRISRK